MYRNSTMEYKAFIEYISQTHTTITIFQLWHPSILDLHMVANIYSAVLLKSILFIKNFPQACLLETFCFSSYSFLLPFPHFFYLPVPCHILREKTHDKFIIKK